MTDLKLTIEPHGNGHAVYSGREQGDYDPGDGSFYSGSHGNRLFNVTDATEAGLQVAHEMVAAVNAVPELLTLREEVGRLREALNTIGHSLVCAPTDYAEHNASELLKAGNIARTALNQEPKP